MERRDKVYPHLTPSEVPTLTDEAYSLEIILLSKVIPVKHENP